MVTGYFDDIIIGLKKGLATNNIFICGKNINSAWLVVLDTVLIAHLQFCILNKVPIYLDTYLLTYMKIKWRKEVSTISLLKLNEIWKPTL